VKVKKTILYFFYIFFYFDQVSMTMYEPMENRREAKF